MSSLASLKCTNTNCSFETADPAALATHLTQSSTNGDRWVCQGKTCTAMFCGTAAMDGDGGHHYTCQSFLDFRTARKYGFFLTRGKTLELMSRRTAAQMNGTVPLGPQPGFSKPTAKSARKRKIVKKSVEPKKKTAEPRKRQATDRLDGASKRRKDEDKEQAQAGPRDGNNNEDDTRDELVNPLTGITKVGQTKTNHRFGTTTIDEAYTAPACYGCTHCSVEFPTYEAAEVHTVYSNDVKLRRECLGCKQGFCFDKAEFLMHIDVCAAMKDWMQNNNIAWNRIHDRDIMDQADKTEERRTWPARNDTRYIKKSERAANQNAAAPNFMTIGARVTAKKVSSNQSSALHQLAHPATQVTSTNEERTYNGVAEGEDLVEQDRRHVGLVRHYATRNPVPATPLPANVGQDDCNKASSIEAGGENESVSKEQNWAMAQNRNLGGKARLDALWKVLPH